MCFPTISHEVRKETGIDLLQDPQQIWPLFSGDGRFPHRSALPATKVGLLSEGLAGRKDEKGILSPNCVKHYRI